MAKALANMQKLAPGAKVTEEKRFPNSVSASELKKWAETMK